MCIRDRGGLLAIDVIAGGRVGLMAGHAGGGVVQNHYRDVAAVVYRAHQARDAAVNKGTVPNDSDRLFGEFLAPGLVQPVACLLYTSRCV